MSFGQTINEMDPPIRAETHSDYSDTMKQALNRDFQRGVVAIMKSATSWISNAPLAISLEGRPLGLMPVTPYHLEDAAMIRRIATWRNDHQYAYPSRFTVSEAGTRNWLRSQVIENPSRLLFLVVDNAGNALGHAGILLSERISEVEMDNILRGEQGHPAAMFAAMQALEEFSYRELGVDSSMLRVLKSNERARRFYEKLGYEVESETPLKQVEADDGSVTLTPVDDDSKEESADHFLAMRKSLIAERPGAERILTAGPSIGPRERAYCAKAVAIGWNDRHSDYLNKFEAEFAEYIGAEFALATSSCTGALHLSLLALGVGPGDEVIVPEVTWVATASAVTYVGATPVFCDVDPNTWCMSVDNLRSKITPRTRAVMPVHLYGFPADMQGIMSVCDENGIRVVEDAAPAIGAQSTGRVVGSFGDFGCFSFQGAKMLVTGEGGMLVTSDEELYVRAKKLQEHGRKPGTFWIEQIGLKYKMSNQTAALGLAQLQRSELQIARKTQISRWYREFLGDCEQVTMQQVTSGGRSIHWMNSIRIRNGSGITRDELASRLAVKGIDTRPVFPAISSYPIWGRSQPPGPTAAAVGAESINLPSGVLLSQASVKRVCDEIKIILKDREAADRLTGSPPFS